MLRKGWRTKVSAAVETYSRRGKEMINKKQSDTSVKKTNQDTDSRKCLLERGLAKEGGQGGLTEEVFEMGPECQGETAKQTSKKEHLK